METKICKMCKSEIDKKAKRCPKCGAKFGIPVFVKVLIIIGVVIACIVGCVSSCTKGVDDAINETKNEDKDVNGNTSFKVGETFENKHITVKLTDVNLDYKNYSQYASIKSGYKIVQFKFEAKNIGEKDSELFSYVDFDCFADDESMEQFYSVGENENDAFSHDLSKGKSGKGSIFCEVPKDAKKITVDYETSLFDSKIEFIGKE